MGKYSLLLVENDQPAKQSLYRHLTENGCSVKVARSPQEIQLWLNVAWPDVVVVNLLAADLDPAAIDAVIRDTNLDVPRLAVVSDTDYHTEVPGNAGEFSFCLRSNLVTVVSQAVSPDRFLRFASLVIDTHHHTIRVRGQVHRLTPKLYALLIELVKNAGHIVYRKALMQAVWRTDYMGDTRTLDVHVRWLRQILEENPSRPRHLLTIRGAGYRFIINPNA